MAALRNSRTTALLFVFFISAAAAQLPPAVQRPIDFAKDVQPLLQSRCYTCHGPKLQMSGMRFDKKAAAQRAIQAGASADSLLIQRVAATTGKPQMPPSGQPLTATEIGILRAWIEQGAAWPASSDAPPHWAFQAIRHPVPPHGLESRLDPQSRRLVRPRQTRSRTHNPLA